MVRMRQCEKDNCERIHYAKGLCVKHYKKSERYVIYSAWRNMVQRCENPAYNYYADYGGRGITVCERWRGENGLKNFIADMGSKPTPQHTLDRVDVNGDYSPDNCRWATPTEQNLNMRIRKDNKSGVVGVGYDKRYQKWRARIKLYGIEKHIGYFNSFNEAVKARKEAFDKYARITTIPKRLP